MLRAEAAQQCQTNSLQRHMMVLLAKNGSASEKIGTESSANGKNPQPWKTQLSPAYLSASKLNYFNISSYI